MRLTGIVLAGGKSSRMGVDKGLISFKGKKMVEYSIDLLRPFCDEIIISSNQMGYELFGFPVIMDNYNGCGPVGGLEATLKHSKTEWNVVLGCDTPFLKSQLIELLIEKAEDFDCIIPSHDKGIEPLVAVYNKRLSVFFEEKIKHREYKLQKMISEINASFFNVEFLLTKYPKLFCNLNSKEDMGLV